LSRKTQCSWLFAWTDIFRLQPSLSIDNLRILHYPNTYSNWKPDFMLFWSWSCVISSMAFAQNPIWARNDQSLKPKPVHTLRHYTQDGSENLTLELKAWHCYTYTVLLTPHIPIHTCYMYELWTYSSLGDSLANPTWLEKILSLIDQSSRWQWLQDMSRKRDSEHWRWMCQNVNQALHHPKESLYILNPNFTHILSGV